MRVVFFLLISSLFLGCQSNQPEVKTGSWRGVIELQGQELPFVFTIQQADSQYSATLINGSEKLELSELVFFDDSVSMVMHIFDAQLRARIKGDSLSGFFTHNYAVNYRLPFKAKHGQSFRFAEQTDNTSTDFSGTYAVSFFKDNKEGAPAIGIFRQSGSIVEGTFLRPAGDYRFLEGNVLGDTLYLSTFDGNHLFVFRATKKGDSLLGDYWSGKSRHETWKGVKDDNAKLPDAASLTYLKEGYDRIDFTFPDVDGNPVSPSDERFKNKVLILQIFGTWCPNCMDETKFLSEWYRQNKERGVEILALAYEQKPDFDYASKRVKLMKDRLNVPYDFVIAGVNDNAKASETLPMLNRVVAFPTTIFIGKDGKVKHIHTGFSGPGTGYYHEQYKEAFNELVNELLAEDPA